MVGRSGRVLAFRDIDPVAPVHVLLIPKQHVRSAAELGEDDGELLGELFGLAGRIAAQEGLDGWRLLTNVGGSGGQAVPHLHFHLVGGRPMGWPPG
ncbi:MAG: HIT domain-containing protein [Actinomycetota bacterium]|nr:HIT domain-containing protein [Actinomycetota bacterium]